MTFMLGKNRSNYYILLLLIIFKFIIIHDDAYAVTIEDEFIEVFELLCLNKLNQPNEIISTIKQLGGHPMPADTAKSLLAPKNGDAWFLPSVNVKGATFAIALTDDGVCTLFNNAVDKFKIRDILINTFNNRLLNKEEQGSDVVEFYAVRQPNIATGEDIKALVSIQVSKLQSVTGLFLNAAPEKLVKQNNINISQWP